MNNTPTPRTDERKASFALDTIRQLEAELTAVTEQLTAARKELHTLRLELHTLKMEVHTLRDQRDRLAEALNRISEYQGVDDEDPKTMAIEALQSLTQNKP